MIIKNTSAFTGEEAIEDLALFSKTYYYKKFIFPAILAIIGILITIIVSMQGNRVETLTLGMMFLIFSIVLVAFNFMQILLVKKRLAKKNPFLIEKGMVNIFTFKEESFFLQNKIGDTTVKIEYAYANLKKIIEYDTKICFVLPDGMAYVCKKDAFQSKKEMELFFYGLQKHKTKIKRKMSKQQ